MHCFHLWIVSVNNNSIVQNSWSVDQWDLPWCRPVYFCSIRLTSHTNKTSEVSLSMMDEPGGPQGTDIDITAGQHPDVHTQPVCGADSEGSWGKCWTMDTCLRSEEWLLTQREWKVYTDRPMPLNSHLKPRMGRIPAEFLRRWDYFLLRWLMRRNESTFCSLCCWWYHDKLFNARPNFTVCFKANGTSWHFQRMSVNKKNRNEWFSYWLSY